jgi:hypothetical protein
MRLRLSVEFHETLPSTAKAALFFRRLTARLKPCRVTGPRLNQSFLNERVQSTGVPQLLCPEATVYDARNAA